ncbi:MAG: mercuric transport protein MerTP [Flavobacteriales bacterium]|jgi:copper ion binding protein|nr:mercuric transport protein MerTP [Flavobacteriales bacterium]
MEKGNSKKAIITGVIAALAASSCCIPPLIAAIAGIGGASSSLSWMEPFRPYLIGIAIIAIGYAWYAHLNPKKVDDCGCEIVKPKFYQKRSFLIGMTLFSFISITIPYYSHLIFPDNKKEVVVDNDSNIKKVEIQIEGMTCDACQNHVDFAVNELNGIVSVKTSYEKKNTVIEFDTKQTSIEEINQAINSIGYKPIKNN